MKTDRIITLDIGTDGIRMAVVALSASGEPRVLDSGTAAYSRDLPADLPHEAVVAMTLKQLMDGRTPGTNRVCFSIDGQSVFSRLVKLPMVASDQREKTIRHEAVQHIPFPIDEVVWDAHVVNPEASEPEVLLVAVKSELLEGLVHAVQANGLSIERISVAPVALDNAVRASACPSGAVLLVDSGSVAANLIFVDGARTFFRTLPVGGNDPGRLVQEIGRSISFFRSQHQGHNPERVLVCGTDAEALTGQLSVPSDVVDASVFSVCAGLAAPQFTDINLLPDSLRRTKALKRRQPLWLASLLIFILLLAVWIVNLDLQLKQTQVSMASVGKTALELSRIEQQLIPLEQEIAELNDRAAVYRSALDQRSRWLNVLGEISRLLPEGMFLLSSEPIESMDQLSGTRITVVSYLDKEPENEDAVKQLRDTLRASELFSEKTKVYSRPSKKLFAREFVLDVYFAEEES